MSDSIVPQEHNALFDSIRKVTSDGREFWSARELMDILGYTSWQKFRSVIDLATENLETLSALADEHFLPVELKTLGRPKTDFLLSRLACYHVAICCDSRGNDRVKAAKYYFVVKTRQAELQEQFDRPEPQPLPVSVLKEAAEALGELYGKHYQHRAFRTNLGRHYPTFVLPPVEPEEMPAMPKAETLLRPTDIAKELGLICKNGSSPSPRKVNELLAGLGFQEKVGDHWNPMPIAEPHCVRKPVETGGKTDKDQLFWYPSILPILRQALKGA